jgi:hypothetical protein
VSLADPAVRPPRTAPVFTLPLLFVAFAAAVLLAALGDLLHTGLKQTSVALAFGAAIACGEALRVTLPGGRDTAPLAATVALAYSVTGDFDGVAGNHGAAQCVVVAACATAVGMLPQVFAGRPPAIEYAARRIVVVAASAGAFRCATLLLPGRSDGLLDVSRPRLFAFVLVVVLSGAVLLDNALAALLRQTGTAPGAPARGPARRWARMFVLECRVNVRVCPAVMVFAAAIALSAPPLGAWVLLAAAAPMLVMHRSLRRYAAIHATYHQTIRALSRVTEIAGYTEPGHARRVCRLALAVGRELGLGDGELLDLEYAALLHDIGQLSLTDPIPGGATVLIARPEAARVASLGADVVRQTGVLDQVADILERQVLDYCADLAREPVHRAAAIIRTVNAFDDLVGGALDPDRRLVALRRIRLGAGTEYDPRVVEALTRLVDRPDPGCT